MRIFVESLKRLYVLGQVEASTVRKLQETGKLSEEEVNHILQKDGDE